MRTLIRASVGALCVITIGVLSIPNAYNVFERYFALQHGNSSRYMRSAPRDHGHISMLPTWVLQSLCERASLEIAAEGTGYCYWEGHFWFPDRKLDHLYSYVSHYRLRPAGSTLSVS